MEYWMIPSSSIYVWKEERPEKPVMVTKIVKIGITDENQT